MKSESASNSVDLEILGVEIRVLADSPSAIGGLKRKFSRFITDCVSRPLVLTITGAERDSRLEFDGRTANLAKGRMWPTLTDVINLLVKKERNDLFFLHASSVLTARGAILFIGSTTSGKTTLALSMAELGYSILAEDLCAIRPKDNMLISHVTSMEVRSGTKKLLKSPFSISNISIARTGLPYSIDSIFLMRHKATETLKKRDLSVEVQEWRQLVGLVYGSENELLSLRSSHISFVTTPNSFQRAPELTQAAPGHLLLDVMRHLHPSTASTEEVLTFCASLLDDTTNHVLCPGRLSDCAELICNSILQ